MSAVIAPPIAQISNYRVVLDMAELEACLSAASAEEQIKVCEADKDVRVTVQKGPPANPPGVSATTYNLSRDVGQAKSLPLPVSIADGNGGLFTSVVVRPDLVYADTKRGGRAGAAGARIGPKSRLTMTPQGTSLDTLQKPEAVGW